MLDDWPDERLFLKIIGQIIASSAPNAPARIYGEMVALLWAEGKHRAAIRLGNSGTPWRSSASFTFVWLSFLIGLRL
jgi:hypothetical protein